MSTETVVRTACPAHCGNNCCGVLAHVRDGKVVKLEPADFPAKWLHIKARGKDGTRRLLPAAPQSAASLVGKYLPQIEQVLM